MNITIFKAIFGGISLVLASVGGAWVTGSAAAGSVKVPDIIFFQ